ncbi:hypothetical protein GSI_13341 [Ganoderma sinense ZZ0214-1]|uniref:F-box domain-containing protein n=1 Tax=Ganoderma sinense ZZ0214-1 TaxID=1077348 RepID=A0A2G8RVB5_9APHY|nr:hypothetical protein GSI_13341 [Ganoderma sinense ZZ0214-1]
MPSNLPVELAECAVDFLHDDVHSLAACALASRTLLPATRFHIWRDLNVPVQTQPQHPRIQGLLEILDGNADLAPLVRSLTLRAVLSSRLHRERWDDGAGTMRLWEKFPNLRVLKFVSFHFPMGLHQLLPVAYSLPNLEELAVLDAHALLPRLYSRPRPSYRESIVALDAPPKLQRLSIAGGSVSWSFMEDLAKALLEPGMRAPLDALDLSCIANSAEFMYVVRDHTETLPSQAWAPVVASLGQMLRQCTLGLLGDECYRTSSAFSSLPRRWYGAHKAVGHSLAENLANLYDSLKQCTRLESLGIVCCAYPAEGFDYRPFLFVHILADLLLSSPGPFPQLAALSISWRPGEDPEPELESCADSAAWTKLAHALENRARYPVLQRLAVALHLSAHTRSAEEREEIASLESVMRSCLARVALVGVQVEVSVD